MSADRDALRRRIYDAARRPAIRLSESTLALAVDGGVFHLNSTEADEIARAVMDIIGPIIDERDRLWAELTQHKLVSGDITVNQARATLGYQSLGPAGDTTAARQPTGPCEDCSCCTAAGCHTGPDSTCPADRLGDSACPCTGD